MTHDEFTKIMENGTEEEKIDASLELLGKLDYGKEDNTM